MFLAYVVMPAKHYIRKSDFTCTVCSTPLGFTYVK